MGADGGGSYFTVRYFAVLGGEGWGEEPVAAGGRPWNHMCVQQSYSTHPLCVPAIWRHPLSLAC
jgi:hypothetical protein